MLFPAHFDDTPDLLGQQQPNDITELAMVQRKRIRLDSDILGQDLKQLANEMRDAAAGQ